MKIFKNVDKRIAASGIFVAFAAAAFFCILNNLDLLGHWFSSLKYYLAPVTGGLMLAYILRPFARFMERVLLKKLKSEKLRVHIAGISTVFLLLIIIYFLIQTLIPQTINSLQEFITNFDTYIDSIKGFIARYAGKIDAMEIDVDELIGSSDEILHSLGDWIQKNLDMFINIFYQFGTWFFNLIIIVAMSVYALLDRKNIKRGLVKLEFVVLGRARSERVNEIVERGDSIMLRFLGSNLLDALIIGVINFIFLSIFKAPYAVMLSVFLGVFNFVPTFGPIVGGIIAAGIMLLTKPSLFIGFAIFTIVLQQVDGNVIKPVLFGDTTGMSPFWVLVAIVVGGRIFGIAGMILGVPIFALFSSVYSEIIDKHLKRARKEEAEAASGAAPPEPPEQPEPPQAPEASEPAPAPQAPAEEPGA